jgi:undecaprenyl pyrophosphate synthase
MNRTGEIFMVLILCIVLAAAAFFCGKIDEAKETSEYKKQLQNRIDSLTTISEQKTILHEHLKDSLKNNTEAHETNIELINAVKKTIRNEIAKTKQSTFDLPDSAVQYHVDSIRSAGGFKAN